MINQQLLDYIKQQLEQGVSNVNIKNILIANGWQEKDVDEGFATLNLPSQSPPPVKAQTQPSSSRILSQAATYSSEPSSGKLKKILIIAIAAIIVVSVAGGGAFAYFNYFQTPEMVVGKMITKIEDIKTLEYSGEIKMEIDAGSLIDEYKSSLVSSFGSGLGSLEEIDGNKRPRLGESKEKVELLADFTGAYDIGNPEELRSLLSFDMEAGMVPGVKIVFGSEVRNIGKVVYIKLSDLPTLGFFDLGSLKNQWIKIDTDALSEQLGSGMVPGKFDEEIDKAQSEEMEKIKTILSQADYSKIFKITEKFPNEEIEGVNSYHYGYMIDKEEVKNLVITIIESWAESMGETIPEEDIKEFEKSFETIESPEGEIWIGKKDLLPHKISFNLKIKEIGDVDVSGDINYTLFLKNFNKPVVIEAPAQSQTIEELMKGLFGGGLDDGLTDADQDLSQLCSGVGGVWLSKYRECESSSSAVPLEKICQETNGRFSGCASPCRHENKSRFCIQSCELVCSY